MLSTHPGRPDAAVELGRRGAVRRAQLLRLGVPSDAVDALPDAVRAGDWLVTIDHADAWASALGAAVDAFAAANPLQARMPQRAASEAIGLPDVGLVGTIAERAGLVQRDGHLTRPGAVADLGAAEAGLVELERRLAEDPFAAPERDEPAALGLDARHLATAVRLGRLVELADQVVLSPRAPALAMRALSSLPQPFTAAEAKAALGTTRRVAIPLLERLDRLGWTRRLDDSRRHVVR